VTGRGRRAPACLALAALLTAAGCERAAPGGGAGGPRNLLLLTVDTLRADHLGAYGYARDVSPELDALARESVRFERAQSSSSWTLPGLASVFTARYTSSHGCWYSNSRLDEDERTLAELLAARGWDTAAVASHVFLARRHGLGQGFGEYDEELVFEAGESHLAVSSPAVSDKGVAWLEARAGAAGGAPWFLWLHYFDPHHRYLAHAGVSEAFGTEADRDLYDGEIAFTSRAIGRVLERLDGLGLADDTIVVLLADHGEEFGEHGGWMHRRTLYREVLRVPLLFRVPGIEPAVVDDVVSVVDVLPTLLELLDVAPPDGIDGRSLVPLLRGEPLEPRPALAELRTHKSRIDALVEGRYKLVVDRTQGAVELYDLVADPLERQNLAAREPERRAAMMGRLKAAIDRAASLGEGRTAPARVELSDEDRARLRDLGYAEDS